MLSKKCIEDLSLFGGSKLFKDPKSTSNLVRPDFDAFLKYSLKFYEVHQYTNNGPNVQLLERRLANFHDTTYCVSFCSGFWALALTISALALKEKSEIVIPSLTYRRLADIVAWNNYKPHFCEVDEISLAINATTALPELNENTALILAVHPIVNCCDIEGLVSLARERKIPLIFDSVESVYESVEAGKVGRFGDAEIFSLHASKFMNGFEGGYVTTNNPELARNLIRKRTFGFEGMDNVSTPGGMNAKLNEIHAAMALASLDSVEEQVHANHTRYNTYQELLHAIPAVRLLEFDENHPCGYKNIVIELLDDFPINRSDTLRLLNAENILARPYYYPPLHRKEMQYAYVSKELPITDYLSKRFLNLPCGYFVDRNDIETIVHFLLFLTNNAEAINSRLQVSEI